MRGDTTTEFFMQQYKLLFIDDETLEHNYDLRIYIKGIRKVIIKEFI